MFSNSRMAPPKLPTWQDCHELWSKKQRKHMKEQQAAAEKMALSLDNPDLLGGSV